jgi:hypothetical protein
VLTAAQTSTPTLEFFSVVATILPIAFLAGVVELRLSLTSRMGPAAPERLFPIGGDEDIEFIRSLVVLSLVVATILGEIACLNTLWNGEATGDDGVVAAVALALDGMVFLLVPVRRWATDIRADTVTWKRIDNVLKVAIGATLAVLVVVWVVGRFT